jgi:hypothetical protein
MGFLKKLNIPKSRDGRSKHPLYKKWKTIMEISYDRESATKVHEPWWNFWNFVNDVMPLYEIRRGDIFCRVDASKDWMKGNVWFVKDAHESVWGRSGTHHIELDGKQVSVRYAHKLAKAKGLDVCEQTIRNRAAMGKEVLGKKYEGRLEKYEGIGC